MQKKDSYCTLFNKKMKNLCHFDLNDIRDKYIDMVFKKYDDQESDNNDSDADESDSKESGADESDNEESDGKESDGKESYSEESDTEESDGKESDGKESDSKEYDNEESDSEEHDFETNISQKLFKYHKNSIDKNDNCATVTGYDQNISDSGSTCVWYHMEYDMGFELLKDIITSDGALHKAGTVFDEIHLDIDVDAIHKYIKSKDNLADNDNDIDIESENNKYFEQVPLHITFFKCNNLKINLKTNLETNLEIIGKYDGSLHNILTIHNKIKLE